MVLAAITPEAAADGVPMPGKHESPHRNNPSTGVFKLGNGKGMGVNFSRPAYGADVPAAQAMPYVPRSRRRNASCANGDPTMWNSARSRASGMQFSKAFQRISPRSSLYASYSALPGSRDSQVSYGSPPDE